MACMVFASLVPVFAAASSGYILTSVYERLMAACAVSDGAKPRIALDPSSQNGNTALVYYPPNPVFFLTALIAICSVCLFFRFFLWSLS